MDTELPGWLKQPLFLICRRNVAFNKRVEACIYTWDKPGMRWNGIWNASMILESMSSFTEIQHCRSARLRMTIHRYDMSTVFFTIFVTKRTPKGPREPQMEPSNRRFYEHGVWYIYPTLPGIELTTCLVHISINYFFEIRDNSHNTRGHSLTLRCRNININLMKNSIVNRHINCWNCLPNCTVHANSIGAFKKELNKIDFKKFLRGRALVWCCCLPDPVDQRAEQICIIYIWLVLGFVDQ